MGRILTLGVTSIHSLPGQPALRSPRVQRGKAAAKSSAQFFAEERQRILAEQCLNSFRQFMPIGTKPLHRLNYDGSGGKFSVTGRPSAVRPSAVYRDSYAMA